MDEIISLLPARQRRSLTRGPPDAHIKLLERLRTARAEDSKKPVRTHVRDFIVLPEMVGQEVHVHNGKEFIRVRVQPEMIGHYLGEFAPTCKVVRHSAPGIGATKGSTYVPLK
jgi:small subunit ribosomal protein S19